MGLTLGVAFWYVVLFGQAFSVEGPYETLTACETSRASMNDEILALSECFKKKED